MKNFEFKEQDIEGQSTLEVIAQANHFNEWMFKTIQPFCNGKILEIGSGIGNISAFFIQKDYPIVLSDIRNNYCEALRNKFKSNHNVEDVIQLDLVTDKFQSVYKNHEAQFDTVFALNVVEHIENDSLAIENSKFLLKKGGQLIILVPAYNTLYNHFDKALGHYRRYTKKTLSHLFTENNFEIIYSQYFNLAGILGWYVSGKLQKNETIPGGQMKFYNSMVPVFRLLDKIVFQKAGLSVIAIGRK